MDQRSIQNTFEGRLEDMEKLMDVRHNNSSVRKMKSLDDMITAKSGSLAKYVVYLSESTSLKDIERLLTLRYVPGHCVYEQSERYLRTTCLDAIIQRKICRLVDSDDRKLDLDPFDALQRMTTIQRRLPSTNDESFFPTEIDNIVAQKMDFLAKCMASPKRTAEEGSNLNDVAHVFGTYSLNNLSPVSFGISLLLA